MGAAAAKMIGVDQLLQYVEHSEKKISNLQVNMDKLNKKLQNPAETQFVVVALPTRL